MPTPPVDCSSCQAACCRMEVMIIGDTGMPNRFIEVGPGGSETMKRLADGWCAALDRNTMRCTQYAVRPDICREFAMGGKDCLDVHVDVSEKWLGS